MNALRLWNELKDVATSELRTSADMNEPEAKALPPVEEMTDVDLLSGDARIFFAASRRQLSRLADRRFSLQ